MATKVTMKVGPLITAPVRVLTAAKEDDDNELKTVCVGTKDKPHAAVRVNQKYRCPHKDCTIEHSSYHPFPRGRENADHTFTVLTREELSAAEAGDDVKETLTLLCCPKDQVDSLGIPSGKFYWLGVGEGAGRENYGLIRDVIRATIDTHVWVTEWAYRTAPSLVRVVLVGDVLGIQQLARPDKVAQKPNVDVPAYDERFLPLAMQAADFVKADFDPETFADTRSKKITAMLELAGTVEGAAEDDAPSTVVASAADAMVADLAAWIEQNGGSVSASSDTGAKKPARKRAAKKVAEEAPPKQPLPAEVPENVAVVAPKKRAPRKTAAVKKTA